MKLTEDQEKACVLTAIDWMRRSKITNLEQAAVMAKALLKMCPDGKSFTSIEFSTNQSPTKATLTPDTKKILTGILIGIKLLHEGKYKQKADGEGEDRENRGCADQAQEDMAVED